MRQELNCIGWWEQHGFGRQSMQNLVLTKEGEAISGSGQDKIAAFQLEGKWSAEGSVTLFKHYDDRHSVLYAGQYDGEGTLYGSWAIGEDRGNWAIKILGCKS